MNHTEKKYAQDRIHRILLDHIENVRREEAEDLTPALSVEEKLRMVRTGEVEIILSRAIEEQSRYGRDIPSILDMCDFPVEREIQNKNERVATRTAERIERVKREAANLSDELMLGSSAEVLAKLREFAAMEF